MIDAETPQLDRIIADLPDAEGREFSDPSLFADLDVRAEVIGQLHQRTVNGILPMHGLSPDSLGIDAGDTDPAWAAIGMDALHEASKNKLLGAKGSPLQGTRAGSAFAAPEEGGVGLSATGILFMEENTPPEAKYLAQDGLDETSTDQHTIHRKHVHVALMELFKGRDPIESVQTYLQVSARRVVNEVIEEGRCDAAGLLSTQLPLQTIGDMIGIPAEKRQGIRDASNATLLFQDPEIDAMRAESQTGVFSLMIEMAEIAASAEVPSDIDETLLAFYEKLQSRHVEHKGERYELTDKVVANMMLMLAVAGNETSRNAIAGGIYALAQHPDQRDYLAQLSPDDPEYEKVWDNAVNEILRWVSPVIGFGRRADKDTQLSGNPVKTGESVMLWYAAANRDPGVFPNPDEFNIFRDNADQHVAFGIGRHRCVGDRVAKAQIKTMLQEITRRMPDFELDGAAAQASELRESSVITNWRKLNIVFTPGEQVAA